MREKRSEVIYGRVTAEEKDLIRRYANECGTDVSNLTRELLLREIGTNDLDAERRSATRLFQLYLRTTRDALELREGFTAERFAHICEELGISDLPGAVPLLQPPSRTSNQSTEKENICHCFRPKTKRHLKN